MKILKLRFKNLNSLYGEWTIDFTDPEYVSSGIFALTGPTGAGKTTILDAVCLALYGTTPRLGKITKSGNEIMSRQTGECCAEVLFESQAGRFLCHWSQRRARKSAHGSLQDQKHEIADAETGELIENRKSLVPGVIEEKTGMDFSRFTRSTMLAQGGFDTFLKAEAEEKSRILEQITGTEIYSEISRRVHERRREEQEKLDRLEAETSGIAILEPEQEEEIQRDLEAKQKEERQLAGKLKETKKSIEWLISIDNLKKELSTLSEEAVDLRRRIEAFEPERGKLSWAEKAASLDGAYAMLKAVRDQQSKDRTELRSKEKDIPEMESSVGGHAESFKSAELKTIQAKEERISAAPLIREVRSLDQKLSELKETVSEHEESFKKDEKEIDAQKQVMLEKGEKRDEAEKNLKPACDYLKQHARDEWLVSGLAGVEEQLGNLLSRQEEISRKEEGREKAHAALERAVEELEESAEQYGVRKQELEVASEDLRQEKNALSELLAGRTLKECRAEKEDLLREKSFLLTAAQLEDHRARLQDGEPCPLCGAEEHPFAEGNVPEPDETEEKIDILTKLIEEAEGREGSIKQLEKAEADARENLNKSEMLQASAAKDKNAAEETFGGLEKDLEKVRAAFAELKQAASARLQPLGIEKIPDDDFPSLLELLRERLIRWQDQVEKKNEIEERIKELGGEIESLDAVIETRSGSLEEKREGMKAEREEQASLMDKREELYGDKNPDDEESRLSKAVDDAEEAEKNARDRHAESNLRLNELKTQIKSLKDRIDLREPDLKEKETGFSEELAQTGFSDEKRFLEARLTREQRNDLSAEAKKLDNSKNDIESRRNDREKRLAVEEARKVTDKTLEELEPQSEEHEKSLLKLSHDIGGFSRKLEENKEARERAEEKRAAVDAQRKECRKWDKLHGLIGSADGKKYRNFAQGLTFDLMVSHANRQLQKMTDRYLLIRDNDNLLELNVVDNYQAGETRSTKNLSGGESFIASLALALGLSRMASRNVRVDSLFLDEGFGTLDEKSLETALETLSGLHQDGKLIGIISHISELKERIPTQITVTPRSGGRSSLAGPGCDEI